MLPGAQWQKFKFLDGAHTLFHLIACKFGHEIHGREELKSNRKRRRKGYRHNHRSIQHNTRTPVRFRRQRVALIQRFYQLIQLLLLQTGRQWWRCRWLIPEQPRRQPPAQRSPPLPPGGPPAHLSHLAGTNRVQWVQIKKLLDEDYKCKTSKMELKAAGEQMQNPTVINHTLWWLIIAWWVNVSMYPHLILDNPTVCLQIF